MKNMKKYEKVLKSIKKYEKLWKIMKKYEKLWKIMKTYEKYVFWCQIIQAVPSFDVKGLQTLC